MSDATVPQTGGLKLPVLGDLGALLRRGDIALAIGVMTILVVLILPLPPVLGPAPGCGCKSWGPFTCGLYAPWFGCWIFYSTEQCGWVYYYPGCGCFLPLEEIATYPPCEDDCEEEADPCEPSVDEAP